MNDELILNDVQSAVRTIEGSLFEVEKELNVKTLYLISSERDSSEKNYYHGQVNGIVGAYRKLNEKIPRNQKKPVVEYMAKRRRELKNAKR